jgi:glycerophosphoryl diester phosphodiesterase
METDVQYTADGHLICLHDFTLDRTTDVTNSTGSRCPARAFSLADIQRLDAGSWFGPEFAGERVPALVEAAAESRAGRAPANLLVEIKDTPQYGGRMESMVEEVARVLREARLPDPARPFGGVILQSFHPEPLKHLARIAPEFTRFQLSPPFRLIVPSRFDSFEDALNAAAAYAAGIGLPDEETAPDVVQAIHARGLRVFTWTVNDRDRMRALRKMGIEGIITDDPAAAREALRV